MFVWGVVYIIDRIIESNCHLCRKQAKHSSTFISNDTFD